MLRINVDPAARSHDFHLVELQMFAIHANVAVASTIKSDSVAKRVMDGIGTFDAATRTRIAASSLPLSPTVGQSVSQAATDHVISLDLVGQ